MFNVVYYYIKKGLSEFFASLILDVCVCVFFFCFVFADVEMFFRKWFHVTSYFEFLFCFYFVVFTTCLCCFVTFCLFDFVCGHLLYYLTHIFPIALLFSRSHWLLSTIEPCVNGKESYGIHIHR